MKQFSNQARVCFVGDSITHAGIFLKHIVAYYQEHFPTLGVEFYNCGIAGGNLGNTIKVFDEDIAIYDPTHIVLMIGVNDSGRNHLTAPTSKDRYQRLLMAYENYKNNMEKFYQITRERNIELILCTPMPYAEYIESNIEPLHGGYALMQGYAAFVREFALIRGLDLCDYHVAATEYMQSENLYQLDRVHPNPRGHALMAKTFLSSLGIDYTVAETFTDDIEKWYDVTQKLRNIITTEFLTVPGYANMNNTERLAVIQKHYAGMKDGTYHTNDYCGSLIKAYVTEKPRQTEHIEYIKRFMKRTLLTE